MYWRSLTKYPVIIQDDEHYKLTKFEWGVIADYMNTPEKIKPYNAAGRSKISYIKESGYDRPED